MDEAGELLVAPPFPETMAEGWCLFEEASQWRGGSGFGASPLSPSDLQAWVAQEGLILSPWHYRAIRVLDVTFLAAHATEDKDIDFATLADREQDEWT